MIEKIPTVNMSREAWLAERRKSIGGSDAAAILGLNDYVSPFSLWCEKTGKSIPPDVSDKEAVRLGNDLEQYVADRWCEATGKKVRRCNYLMRDSAFPFAHADVDRLVIGENAGLECKTTTSWDIAAQLRAGEIPNRWYCQMVHYMMVTGAERWYLGALVFGVGFFRLELNRNEDEIGALRAAESKFWDKVCAGAPPETDGAQATTEAIRTIYADSVPGKSVELDAVGQHVELYNALTERIAELERDRDAHANAIREFMGDAEKGTYRSTSVSWKSAERRIFDKAKFEAENGPIPDSYYKTTASRSFRVAVKKGI